MYVQVDTLSCWLQLRPVQMHFFSLKYYVIGRLSNLFYRLFTALSRERNRILKILIVSKIWSKNHLKRGRGCPPWRLGQSRFVRAIGKCIGLPVKICLFHTIILCFIEFLTLFHEKQSDLSNSMQFRRYMLKTPGKT